MQSEKNSTSWIEVKIKQSKQQDPISALENKLPWLKDMEQFLANNSTSLLSPIEPEAPGTDFMKFYANEKKATPGEKVSSNLDAIRYTMEGIGSQKINVRKELRHLRDAYEKGVGILKVDEIFDTRLEELLAKNSNKTLTNKEMVITDAIMKTLSQTTNRSKLLKSNDQLLSHRSTLNKFFADRFSYLMLLKKDKFGTLFSLPVRFIVYINLPENRKLRNTFAISDTDDGYEIRSENNMIMDSKDARSHAFDRKRLLQSASDRPRKRRGTLKHPALQKMNNRDSSAKSGNFEMDDQDDQIYEMGPRGAKSKSGADRHGGSSDISKKYEMPQQGKGSLKMDLKNTLKNRLKMILKKFIRVHVLQMEAPKLLRRYSLELPALNIRLPVSVAKINLNAENRRNFNVEEESQKKFSMKMKKLNKMEFSGFQLRDHASEEVTAFAHEYARTEKSTSKQKEKLALEFANASIVNTNISCPIISLFPDVVFKGLLSMAQNKPTTFNYKYAVLIGYRLYIYETEKSKKASVCFEIEPRAIEIYKDIAPGYYALKNGFHSDLFILKDSTSVKLMIILEEIVAYECCVHTLDCLGNLRSMTPKLTDFYMDNKVEDYKFEVLSKQHTTPSEKQWINEMRPIVEKSFYSSLKGLMFHPNLTELSIVNIPLSTKMVAFVLHVVTELKFNMKIIRLEYNELTIDHIGPLKDFLEKDRFSGLEELSLTGNQFGDEGLDMLLGTIVQKLDLDIVKYRDKMCYPIANLKLSHCGIRNPGLRVIDDYARALEKIRLSTGAENRTKYRFSIDLSKNLIDDTGLMKIIDILRAVCAITSLNLDENFLVTPQGITKFIGCLDFVHSLDQLTMRELYIPRASVEYLQRFLYRNIFLNKIILSFEKRALQSFLETNRSLTKYFKLTNEGTSCLANAKV